MITFALKVLAALRAGWVAGSAAMDGRSPVLVDDVLREEECDCTTPRFVAVHSPTAAAPFAGASSCYEGQRDLLIVSLGDGDDAHLLVPKMLDVLAEEADRRDGVRRGPR